MSRLMMMRSFQYLEVADGETVHTKLVLMFTWSPGCGPQRSETLPDGLAGERLQKPCSQSIPGISSSSALLEQTRTEWRIKERSYEKYEKQERLRL